MMSLPSPMKSDTNGYFHDQHMARRTLSNNDDSSSELHISTRNLEPLPSSRHLHQQEQIDSQFTVNKLRLSQVGLCGREEEQDTLMKCLSSAAAAQDDEAKFRELVLIKGYSGVGKSRLASTLKGHVKEGIYCVGKFDLHLRDEPYVGVASACRSICRQLLERSEPVGDFAELIINGIGRDLALLLSKIIPEIKILANLNNEECGDDSNLGPEFGSPESKAQFNYGFRIFIRLVASTFSPLVMILDDLQWADPASLELMQVLLSDVENKNFMIVGLYRSNDVYQDHPLTSTVSNLKVNADESNLRVHELSIGDLSVTDVERILEDALSMDPGTTTDLAQICYQKTGGNPFFLRMFLFNLQAQGLLTFELHSFCWKWDVSDISSRSMATDNVVDLITREMRSYPEDVQLFMIIAACLGSSFEKSHVDVLHLHFSTENRDSVFPRIDVIKALNIAVDTRFLTRNGHTYRFVHDQIQASAFSLLERDDLCVLKSEIGYCLIKHLKPDQLSQSLFVVVNLLNEGAPPSSRGTNFGILSASRLCELNREAARKAMSVSAFESASKYAELGLKLVPAHTKLKSEEEMLRVELLLITAKCHMCLGNAAAAESACRSVLDDEKALFVDKLLAHEVMADTMGNAGDTPSTVKLLLSGLKEAGCKFPRRRALKAGFALTGLFHAKRKMEKMSYEDISKLPLMKDKVRLREMRLLDRLGHFSYMAGDGEMASLSLLKRLDLTWKEGLCESTTGCFSFFALLLVGALGEIKSASRIARIVLELVAKVPKLKRGSARAITVALMVLPWTEPQRKLERSCYDGYRQGLIEGDTESAGWSINWFIEFGFRGGRSLRSLKIDCETYTRQLAELNLPLQALVMSSAHQAVLNLMGESNTTFEMQGSALTKPELILNDTENPAVFAAFQIYQFRLYLLFRNIICGAEAAISYEKKIMKDAVGYSGYADQVFTIGILLFSAAQMTKSRRYAKRARKMCRLMVQWTKKGYPSVHHTALLQAETAAMDGSNDAAKKLYLESIVLSTRSGYLHDAGLANELFARFLQSTEANRGEDEASFRIKEAIRCYDEWGAAKKVELLREEFASML